MDSRNDADTGFKIEQFDEVNGLDYLRISARAPWVDTLNEHKKLFGVGNSPLDCRQFALKHCPP